MCGRNRMIAFSLSLVGLLASVLLVGSAAGYGQVDGRRTASDPSAEKPVLEEIVLNCEVVLGSPTGDPRFVYGNVQLGSIEPGRRYKIDVRVKNPFDRDLSFTGVVGTCGCLKFEADENNLVPARGSAHFTFNLQTPIQSHKVTNGSGFNFIDRTTGQELFRLGFVWERRNMFKISADRCIIEIPSDDLEPTVITRIPILISPPLVYQDLEILVSDNLRDVVARFVQEDGQDFVQITAHRNSVIGSSIAGELTVRRKIGTEDFHAINVVIKLQSAISISPESIRLVKSGANGSFEGKAILRVRTSPKAAHERTGEREPETSVPSVELMVDGKPAKVTVKRLGKSEIYSLIVLYDGQVPTDLGQSISAKWGVRANGRETKIDTFAYLQD